MDACSFSPKAVKNCMLVKWTKIFSVIHLKLTLFFPRTSELLIIFLLFSPIYIRFSMPIFCQSVLLFHAILCKPYLYLSFSSLLFSSSSYSPSFTSPHGPYSFYLLSCLYVRLSAFFSSV